MAIVCGIELNERDEVVVRAAAALARRMHEALDLVHVGEEPDAAARLEALAGRWRSAGLEVRSRVAPGEVHEALPVPLGEERVHLLVVGAGARPGGLRRLVGRTTDRVVQLSEAPVLVVRDPAPFEDWAAERRRLRVVLALDLSQASEAAARWTRAFARWGQCEVVAVHSFGELSERYRYGLGLDVELAEVEKLVARDLQARLAEVGLDQAKLVVRASAERTGDRVAALAGEEHADLVVVGTHHRSAARLPWLESVSQEVLRHAAASVACVGVEPGAPREFPPAPRVRTVLVPTDLAPHTRRALAYAYALVEERGTVHLVHVVDAGTSGPLPEGPEAEPWRRELMGRLELLLPRDIGARRCTTRLALESGKDVAVAIAHAAERLGADLVCLSSRSRGRLARAVGGSVVRELAAVTRRPLVVLPPEEE